jgi:hypothetical protein
LRTHSVEDGRQWFVRYCFADSGVADAFRDRFGGERLETSS